MSLEDASLNKNQKDKNDNSLSRDSDGSGNSDKSISRILKGSSLRSQESQIRLGRASLNRPISRPGSANGHVPSIIMLTSVDHSDATKYSLNPHSCFLSLTFWFGGGFIGFSCIFS